MFIESKLCYGCFSLQVCPVCAMRVGVDMVAHITLQHGNIFKISLSIELLFMMDCLWNPSLNCIDKFFLFMCHVP